MGGRWREQGGHASHVAHGYHNSPADTTLTGVDQGRSFRAARLQEADRRRLASVSSR